MQLGLLSSAVQGHRVQAIAKPQKHPYFRTTLVTCIAEPSAATSPQPVSKCPVAQASSFFANATSSILGRAGPSNANAHTWLEGGLSGQDVPGRLVSGLRPLHDIQGEFIVVTDTTYVDELTLKAKAFATRRDQVFVAESDSLAAQQETLDMVVDALIELGRLKQTGHDTLELKVDDHGTTWTFCTSDYTAAPLELAARLVQEDLVLMRPPSATPAGIAKDSGGDDATSDMQPPRYCMTAAAVVFSFGELEAKLGAPMPLIHAPVPGFEKDLDRLLSKTFDKLRVDKPGTIECVLCACVCIHQALFLLCVLPLVPMCPHVQCSNPTCPATYALSCTLASPHSVAQQLGPCSRWHTG